MTLREERNEQTQQAWRTHFEQERLDLSASVEAALIADGVLSQQWQDKLDEQEKPQPATGGTGIVSPRLSLRSRTLPAASAESFGIATTDSHQVASSHIEEEAEQKSSGKLARLARRFTSTFTAINPAVKAGIPQQQVTVSDAKRSLVQDTEAHQSMPDRGQFSVPADYPGIPLVRVIDTTASIASVVETPLQQPALKEPRSLKRNGKVRLETTEQHALSKASLLKEQQAGEALPTVDVKAAVSHPQAPPIIPEQREKHANTSYKVLSSAIHNSLSGSGVFESEQSEVMVANPCIVASSVVLVTLTTNPGPVVVQYISLQPEIGFTVHLTAPVAKHTTFNYVIVQSDTL